MLGVGWFTAPVLEPPELLDVLEPLGEVVEPLELLDEVELPLVVFGAAALATGL